ncbi:hypothetical protein [Gloeobacter kilaueensis]|uniref:Uncharacterized protein n=1 Tax=Gloeobacter kilaueensis (strain ATCC BAA-2537 / CCAP 1431/1 / ULC 316 / JS1) TaxID=1183438 RepID=U5QQX9_GLOK1|nr:hypothetical protein [Gloeobacter kilaueensis]AGY60054.1 hypothetical protein GKIL_3808 [Gloeobacter kilaueensis JS1]
MAITLEISEALAHQLQALSEQLECTPIEYALAALDWSVRQNLDPLGNQPEPDAESLEAKLIEARNLLLAEQINQGAYLAARLDNLEIVTRSLLNLELQTDKRGYEAIFQAIHQALSDELAQRHYSL